MDKYKVFGHTVVNVVVEVEAENEGKAYKIAEDELCGLIAFCGNGGTDKLVGVDGENQSVSADEGIEYDYIELLDKAERV